MFGIGARVAFLLPFIAALNIFYIPSERDALDSVKPAVDPAYTLLK